MAKLYLIAGHGAGDSGAVGNGYTEAERVRKLCSKIKELGGDNVEYLNPNRNWYADAGINTLSIPKDAFLLEAHMDSGASTAHGGHVIKADEVKADAYDNALVSLLKKILPGRSEMIVYRNNLANPRRARERGINYRIVEFGFISNLNDINVFNNKMEEIAKEVLKAFNIGFEKKEEVKMAKVSLQNLDGNDKQKWKLESVGVKFMLKNKSNGQYLDVSGGSAKDGTAVQTYSKNSSKSQIWTPKQIEKGYNPKNIAPFTIVSAINDKSVLDVKAGLTSSNAPIDIYASNNTNAQKWGFLDSGDGWMCIVNIGAMKALSV